MFRQTSLETAQSLERRRSHPETEQDLELPQLVKKSSCSEGSAWRNRNPAIRQLTTIFRSNPQTKHYPLGLWKQQNNKTFPDTYDTCVIIAKTDQRSRRSSNGSEAEHESRSPSACLGSAQATSILKDGHVQESKVFGEQASNFPSLSAARTPSYMYRQNAGPSLTQDRHQLVNNYVRESQTPEAKMASDETNSDESKMAATSKPPYIPPWELHGEDSFIERPLLAFKRRTIKEHKLKTDDSNTSQRDGNFFQHGGVQLYSTMSENAGKSNDKNGSFGSATDLKSATNKATKNDQEGLNGHTTAAIYSRKPQPPLLKRKRVQFTNEILAGIPTENDFEGDEVRYEDIEGSGSADDDNIRLEIDHDGVLGENQRDIAEIESYVDHVVAQIFCDISLTFYSGTQSIRFEDIGAESFSDSASAERQTLDVLGYENNMEARAVISAREDEESASNSEASTTTATTATPTATTTTTTTTTTASHDQIRQLNLSSQHDPCDNENNTVSNRIEVSNDTNSLANGEINVNDTPHKQVEAPPPINFIHICLLIEQGISATRKDVLRQTLLPRGRDWLFNKGYDLDVMTFDYDHLIDMDESTRHGVLDHYLHQCQSHGLGPFYYALLSSSRDNETKSPSDENQVNAGFDCLLRSLEESTAALQDNEFHTSSRRCFIDDSIDSEGEVIDCTGSPNITINPNDQATYSNMNNMSSNHFMGFIQDLLGQMEVINKRREPQSGLSKDVYSEIWSHQNHGNCDIANDSVERSTELLDKIENLIQDSVNTQPIVIQDDDSDTTIKFVRQLQIMVPTWFLQKPVVIVRHVGKTCKSARLEFLLDGVCRQICQIYGYTTDFVQAQDSTQSVKTLMTLLNRVSRQNGNKQPLVLLMDNVQMLDNECKWIPKLLPPNVHMVVTVSRQVIDHVNAQCSQVWGFHNVLNLNSFTSESDARLNVISALDEVEDIIGVPNVVRHVVCLVTVHANGISVKDIIQALLCDTSVDETIRKTETQYLKFSILCIQHILSPWLHVIYDSGELLLRLTKSLHSVMADRYVTRGDGTPDENNSHYGESIVRAYIGRPNLKLNVICDKTADYNGLVILTQSRLLYFCERFLCTNLTSDAKHEIIKETIFNFNWIGYFILVMSAEATQRLLWHIRLQHQDIATLCNILQSEFFKKTDPGCIASDFVSCIDVKTESACLSQLYQTSKDWLCCAEMSLIPCCPILTMPHAMHSTIPGPGTVLSVFGDNRALVWGLDYGLQVWDLTNSACCFQLGQPLDRHDIIVNEATSLVYYTDNTFLIGWNISDGKQAMKLDLLPKVSRTGRTFDAEKDITPFLSLADVSQDGQLIAVRINHAEMLFENKGVFIVSFSDGCIDIDTVGLHLYGASLTNILFADDGKNLVITQSVEDIQSSTRLCLIHTDFITKDDVTEIDPVSGLAMTQTISRSSATARRKSQLDVIDEDVEDLIKGTDTTSGHKHTKHTDGLNLNSGSQSNDVNITDSKMVAEEGLSNGCSSQRENATSKMDGDDMVMSDSERILPRQSSSGHRSGLTMSASRGFVTRQDAVDMVDEDLEIMLQVGCKIVPHTLRTSDRGFVMGCARNDVARFSVAGRILEISTNTSQSLCDIEDLMWLTTNGNIITVHQKNPAGRVLKMCVWSIETKEIHIEHSGSFRFIKQLAESDNVLIAYNNKILVCDMDSLTCTHAFDFPEVDVNSAIVRDDTLYVGIDQSVVSREIIHYKLSPPIDLSSSESFDGEDGERFHTATAPPENHQHSLTRYGPTGINHAVLLPGRTHTAIDVTGKLKQMNLSDGSMQDIPLKLNIRIVDLFILGTEKLIALGMDIDSNTFSIVRWNLDELTSDPEVTQTRIDYSPWMLSNNKTCLVSVYQCENSSTYTEVFVTSMCVPSITKHYTLSITTGSTNFGISDCGCYFATWRSSPAIVCVWKLETSGDAGDKIVDSQAGSTNQKVESQPEDSGKYDNRNDDSSCQNKHQDNEIIDNANCPMVELLVATRSQTLRIVGNLLIIGSKEGTLHKIHLDTLFGGLRGSDDLLWENRIMLGDISPCGVYVTGTDILAITGLEGAITLLNLSQSNQLITTDILSIQVTDVDISASQALLVASFKDGSIRVWDTHIGKLLCSTQTHTNIQWVRFIDEDSAILAWIDKCGEKKSRFIKFDIHKNKI